MFKLLVEGFGSFVKCDEQTFNKARMNEARILIKSKKKTFINEPVNVIVDGISFYLFVREDFSIHKDYLVAAISKEEGT